MKLEKILDNLNSFEKNSFLKIIDCILSMSPKNHKEIENILSDKNKDLKNIDNLNIVKVFRLVENEFMECIQAEFNNAMSQLDILIDILIRDGNSILKIDEFATLYKNETTFINKKIKEFQKIFSDNTSDLEFARIRDYHIYKECLRTAYLNDKEANLDPKITSDEQSILLTLAKELEVPQEEAKLINYLIIPIKNLEIEQIINNLKNCGIIFFSRKNNMIYVPDEIVSILRKIRGKELSDKFFRRVLRQLREPQINLICRKHNIDWKLPLESKIEEIIGKGISFSGALKNDIFKEEVKILERKKVINELIDKKLKIEPSIKGITIDDKIDNLIKYFENIERDERVSITKDGYEKLIIDLAELIPGFEKQVKNMFNLKNEKVLNNEYLLDFNIKPRDVLEILQQTEIETFAKSKEIKIRGDLVQNILDFYKDSENIYIENFELIGYRDLNGLKENGIQIKESDIAIKFEDITKNIFKKLGFNVDERLRKSINTNKDQIDIVIKLEDNGIIIVECKTIKEAGYNKFSSVSRQLKAYIELAEKRSFKVIKSLLVAPEFSDDFIRDCGLDYKLNLSLITASSLKKILHSYKTTKLKQLPFNLLMRDVLIQDERVIRAIVK
jgi:hypothetical protein